MVNVFHTLIATFIIRALCWPSPHQPTKLQIFQPTKKGAKNPLSKTSQIAADQLQEERRETPNIAISICFLGYWLPMLKIKQTQHCFSLSANTLASFNKFEGEKMLKNAKNAKKHPKNARFGEF